MFEELNKDLAEAKERLRKKQKIESMVLQTKQELKKEQERKSKLENILQHENEDVKKLESFSIAGLFYSVLGSKEQQLEKERQELLAARLKYDECCRTVTALERELASYEETLNSLFGAESHYEVALKRKEESILKGNGNKTIELHQLLDKASDLEAQKKELQEAITSGNIAQSELGRVIKSLESAENWGTWDMMGGGFLATSAKHSRIDEARDYASHTKIALSRFQRELSDVDLSMDIDINIGSFETFADYFFDGLISDWVVQSRIRDSLASVQQVFNHTNRLLSSLERRMKSVLLDLDATKEEMKTVIEKA
ncbi:MAG: hypothetical protein N2484_16205 [Clostridia bacterium]|nr:hypothetical protein [Clostridia bacterium]